ncbi:MAG: DUF5691 domain-containing protein [Chloroflexota bacterium]
MSEAQAHLFSVGLEKDLPGADDSGQENLSQFAQIALLGVERVRIPQLSKDSPLAALDAQLNEMTPEDRLLSLAGVGALYRDAGQLPHRMVSSESHEGDTCLTLPANDAGLPKPSLTEPSEESLSHSLPTASEPSACSRQAGQFLMRMLDRTYKPLLPQFLAYVVDAGCIISNEYLPNLLDYGINQPQYRSLLLQVVSPQAERLSLENPRWAYANSGLTDWDHTLAAWRMLKTGTERQSYLRHLRTQDPALGLDVLKLSWKSERPQERITLIRSLSTGLNIADEPFLEAALDDRNHSVRKKAAELLSCLPASRLSLRMQKATESLLEWTSDEVNSLKINFPDAISPEMQRDGVLIRRGRDQAKTRRAQLLDIVTSTPLDSWTAQWSVPPRDILVAAEKSRWPRTLLQGFVQAAERQRHLEWTEALFDFAPFKLPVTKLIPLLSPNGFDQLLQQVDPGIDAENQLDKEHPLVLASRRWPHAWSVEISKLWLERLTSQIGFDDEQTKLDSVVRTATKQFAQQCDPTLIELSLRKLLGAIHTCPPIWRKTLDESISLLRFRQEMIQAIQNKGNDQYI